MVSPYLAVTTRIPTIPPDYVPTYYSAGASLFRTPLVENLVVSWLKEVCSFPGVIFLHCIQLRPIVVS